VFIKHIFQYVDYENNLNTTFWRGFEADEPRTSGLFKLKKVRTGKKFVFKLFL